jgi:hypothetical protein
MYKKLLFLLLAVLLFPGCKKEKATITPIPAALIKACLFQKDSYWIYRNDSTGAVDCTYVKSEPMEGVISIDSANDYNLRTDQYIRTPVISNLFYQFYFSAGVFTPPPEGHPFLINIKDFSVCWPGIPVFLLYDDSLTNHSFVQFYNCDPEGSGYLCMGNLYFQLGTISNFSVNDLSFSRVYLTKTLIQPGFKPTSLINDTLLFYYSPGNGLVKFIAQSDTLASDSITRKRKTQSWSLLRYHVVH